MCMYVCTGERTIRKSETGSLIMAAKGTIMFFLVKKGGGNGAGAEHRRGKGRILILPSVI